MTLRACRFIVTGNVQGVFFRASTRDQARRLGLCGYAKNLDDGSVEVVAVGDDDALEDMAEWLQHGPPMADVTVVQRTAMGADAAADALTRDDFVIA